MFIELVNNRGTKYLRLVHGYYTKTKNGKMSSNKKVICSIGPLARFDDGEPD